MTILSMPKRELAPWESGEGTDAVQLQFEVTVGSTRQGQEVLHYTYRGRRYYTIDTFNTLVLH
jgi:hypothetical protein